MHAWADLVCLCMHAALCTRMWSGLLDVDVRFCMQLHNEYGRLGREKQCFTNQICACW